MIKKTPNYLLLLFVVLCMNIIYSQPTEVRMLKAMNAGKLPMWDKTMEGVSFSVYPAMPLTVGGVWLYGYTRNDKEMMRNGYKGAATLCLANGLSYALKVGIARKRPFVSYPNDITQRTHVGPLSFPSGHTTAAFATATALSLSTKKWQWAVPAYAYAGLVGYSRMRLGVHYPSDVLAGALIGIGSGMLVWQLDKMIRR